MENILGRQLWDVYENLKKGNRIGFLTDDEFQKYFLGFISYKYLSEKLESYVNKLLDDESLSFEEACYDNKSKDNLREKSIKDIGYFLNANLLYRNIVSSKNYGNTIIEELEGLRTSILEVAFELTFVHHRAVHHILVSHTIDRGLCHRTQSENADKHQSKELFHTI